MATGYQGIFYAFDFNRSTGSPNIPVSSVIASTGDVRQYTNTYSWPQSHFIDYFPASSDNKINRYSQRTSALLQLTGSALSNNNFVFLYLAGGQDVLNSSFGARVTTTYNFPRRSITFDLILVPNIKQLSRNRSCVTIPIPINLGIANSFIPYPIGEPLQQQKLVLNILSNNVYLANSNPITINNPTGNVLSVTVEPWIIPNSWISNGSLGYVNINNTTTPPQHPTIYLSNSTPTRQFLRVQYNQTPQPNIYNPWTFNINSRSYTFNQSLGMSGFETINIDTIPIENRTTDLSLDYNDIIFDVVNVISNSNPTTRRRVIVGDINAQSNTFLYSDTGTEWISGNSGNLIYTDVTRGETGRWMACGGNSTVGGLVSTSTDGSTWTDGSGFPNAFISYERVTYGQGSWIGFFFYEGATIYFIINENGAVRASLISGFIAKSIKYDNGVWITTGHNYSNEGVIYYTNNIYADSYPWTKATISTSHAISVVNDLVFGPIAYNGQIINRWVAVGSNQTRGPILYSDDNGITWNFVQDTTTWFLRDGRRVEYGNNRFVTIGDGGTNETIISEYKFSDDGINWQSTGRSTINYARDISYRNENFIIVGQNYGNNKLGSIQISNNGLHYQSVIVMNSSGNNYVARCVA